MKYPVFRTTIQIAGILPIELIGLVITVAIIAIINDGLRQLFWGV